MKRWLVSGLAVSFAACSPDVPTGPNNSSKYAVAEFDPVHSIIPLPNDLAFIDPATNEPDTHLHAPTTGGTDAQNEFNRDYLNLLDGFPMDSTASVLFDKEIDLATVNFGSVPVIDITNPASPTPVTTVGYPASGTSDTLVVAPPPGGWLRSHHYAMAIIGGTAGVKGAHQETVVGSPTWALVAQDKPLITCDATGKNCVLGTSAIPTTSKDPATQQAEQLRSATKLEALRQNYAPLIAALGAQPFNVPSSDIALLWTFTITSQAEVTFDPLNNAIPFPNDILIDQTTGKVAIPANVGLPPDLVAGLNTLDGFSTSAMILSEFGPNTGPLLQGKLPGTSYTLGPAGPINLVQAEPSKGAPPIFPDGGVAAHGCVNCPPINMLLPDGGPILLPDGGLKPDTLAIVPDVPLTERTRYAAYITTGLKDDQNKNVIPSPVFALVRSAAPLVTAGPNPKSTVSVLSDAQAAGLEPLRQGLKPVFDSLASAGLPRKKVALAWTFTTQSTITTLTQLNAIPTSPAAAPIPGIPLWVQEIPAPAGVPTTNVGHWYIGEIIDVFLLTGSGGVFDPAHPATPKIPFVMSVPASAAPAGGYPTTIYGHGLGRTRTDGFAMSSSLATAGQMMIAIDEPWHGDRNTCTGFGAFLASTGVLPPPGQPPSVNDKLACANPAAQQCNETTGRCESTDRNAPLACIIANPDADKGCTLAGQGRCAPDSMCENATFAAGANGWNLFNLGNFFATRDNIRQQVVSDAQLARVIGSAATGNLGQQAGGITLNPAKINYAGQSLGGILGSLYSAASPVVKNAALNVPGGDPELILLTSPAFAQQKAGFQAGLAAAGVPTDSPLYDTFLIIAKWIIDPADPVNAAPYLVRDTGSLGGVVPNGGGTRRAYVQWIQNDQVVPNPSTLELIRSVLGDPEASGVLLHPSDSGGVTNFWAKRFDSAANPANNHGFLLGSAGAAVAAQAQGEVAGFVAGQPPFP